MALIGGSSSTQLLGRPCTLGGGQRAFTLTGWIRYSSFTNVIPIGLCNLSGGSQYAALIAGQFGGGGFAGVADEKDSSGTEQYSFNYLGSGTGSASTAPTAGVWYFVAAVFTSLGSRASFIHQTGATADTLVLTTGTVIASPYTHLTVGSVQASAGDLAVSTCAIGELALWASELGLAELTALAQGTNPLALSSAAGSLQSYYPLNGDLNDYGPAGIGLGDLGTAAYNPSFTDGPPVQPMPAVDSFYGLRSSAGTNSASAAPTFSGALAAGTASAANPATAAPLFATTNDIRNSTMVGAVAGTPGTLPTNWTHVATSGLSYAVIGSGTESGLPYLDLQVSGTTTANAASVTTTFDNVASKAIPALPGQTLTGSIYAKLISGTLPTYSQIYVYGFNSAASSQTETFSVNAVPNTNGLITQRFSRAAPLANSGTAYATFGYYAQAATSGTVVNFTIRIGAPQLESGVGPTAFVPTSGSQASGNGTAAAATATQANAATGVSIFSGALAAGTASETDSATAAPVFGSVLASGAASTINPATASALFGGVVAAGDATGTADPATGVALFGTMLAAGDATGTANPATAAVSLGALTAAGVGGNTAMGAVAFGPLVAAGQAASAGIGAAAFGPVVASGAAAAADPTTASATFAAPSASGTASAVDAATGAALFGALQAAVNAGQGSSATAVATFGGLAAAGVVADATFGSVLFQPLATSASAQALNAASGAPVLGTVSAAAAAAASDPATASATFAPLFASGVVAGAAFAVGQFGSLTSSAVAQAQNSCAATATFAPSASSFAQSIVAAAGGGIFIPSVAAAAISTAQAQGGGAVSGVLTAGAAGQSNPLSATIGFAPPIAAGSAQAINPASALPAFSFLSTGTLSAANATSGLGLFGALLGGGVGAESATGGGLFGSLSAATFNALYGAASFQPLTAAGNALSNTWTIPALGGPISDFVFSAKIAWQTTAYVFDLSTVLAPAAMPQTLTNEFGFPLTAAGLPLYLSPGQDSIASATVTVTPGDVTVLSTTIGAQAVAVTLTDGVPWTEHILTLAYTTVGGLSGSFAAPLYVLGGPFATSPYLAMERDYPISDQTGCLLYWP